MVGKNNKKYKTYAQVLVLYSFSSPCYIQICWYTMLSLYTMQLTKMPKCSRFLRKHTDGCQDFVAYSN